MYNRNFPITANSEFSDIHQLGTETIYKKIA